MRNLIYSFLFIIATLIASSPALAVTDILNASEDSYVRETSPTKNYGSETRLIADGVAQDPDNGIYGEVKAVIKWDLSSIPADATVTDVKLRMNFTDASSGFYNILTVADSSPWSEGTVTWDDITPGPIVIGTISPLTFGEAPATLNPIAVATVQRWIEGTTPNNGIVIQSAGTNNGIIIGSRESTGLKPTLEVTYTPRGVIPGWQIVQSERVSVAPDRTGSESASCPSGKVVTGGGFESENTLITLRSYPSSPSSWSVIVKNTSPTENGGFRVYAVCANGP